MDTLGAFARGQMARAMGAGLKVFDWHKAARRIKESGAMSASAGLSGDWEWTGGDILRYGRPLLTGESYTYLASIWATPELEIEGNGVEECWCWQSEHPDWDASTRWPQSALDILAGKEPAVVLPEPVVSVPEGEREQVWQHFEDVANSRVRDTCCEWHVSGEDTHGSAGVLEWCDDEQDAKERLRIMAQYPQFKALSIGKWED